MIRLDKGINEYRNSNCGGILENAGVGFTTRSGLVRNIIYNNMAT